MSKKQPISIPAGFPGLLKEIKAGIRQAQTHAILAVNARFSEKHIGRMIAFYRARFDRTGFSPPAVAMFPAPREVP